MVSIIVPCYNKAVFLKNTLDSVLAQTYEKWECIIVDDGSDDNTFDIASRFCANDSRFTFFRQTNQGPAVARNNGIARSSGEFILPLDADDLIDPSYLEKAVRYFITNPETTLVYSKADFFGCETGEWELPSYCYDSFIWCNCIYSCAMFRRLEYDNTSGYNPNMIYGDEDWDFWLSLLNKESIVHRIDEVLFHYRIQKQSRTSDCLIPNIDKAKRLIYHNHETLYKPFCEDVVLLKDINANLKNQLRVTREQLDDIRHSWAYRIGKVLIKPFSFIRSFVKCK